MARKLNSSDNNGWREVAETSGAKILSHNSLSNAVCETRHQNQMRICKNAVWLHQNWDNTGTQGNCAAWGCNPRMNLKFQQQRCRSGYAHR